MFILPALEKVNENIKEWGEVNNMNPFILKVLNFFYSRNIKLEILHFLLYFFLSFFFYFYPLF